MNVICETTGEAHELAPLGVRLYLDGCAYGCLYCYGHRTMRRTRQAFENHARLRPEVLRSLDRDAEGMRGDDREILVTFSSDPYQPFETKWGTTRQAIQILIRHGLRVMILTKGGMRAARDFDLLETYEKSKFGTSVVFTNQADASHWEPGAPPIADRIEAIRQAHGRGIKTWVCLEPVIDPDQALELIRRLHPVVGHWEVGILNYRKLPRPVDWPQFRANAENLLGSLGADYHLKESLTGIGG
ncbi:MAG: radical SAM protein [Thermodesulfobacteriota bacterium]|nr:radical SAM protein [Thermodesulfobacteriota bacterium]